MPSSGFLPNADIGVCAPISVYCDIDNDIGANFNDTRYRCTPISVYTRYRVNPISGIHRYRCSPISVSISQYTDIGDTRYRVYPISGIHRYRHNINPTRTSCHLCIRYRVSECSDVVNIVPDIGHDVSRFCLPGARRGWLSGCWRLFGIAREGMLKCNDLYSLPI